MSRILLFSKTPSTSEGVLHIPIIQTTYIQIPLKIYDYDIVVITSKEAVNALLKSHIDPSLVRLSAISAKTAQYAREHNFMVDSVSDGYAKSFSLFLKNRYKNKKLLYIRAKEVASDVLLSYDNEVIYETTCNDVDYSVNDDDVLIFTSPSTIECFFKKSSFKKSQKVVCIGTTTQAALPCDIDSYLANNPSIESCIETAYKLLKL